MFLLRLGAERRVKSGIVPMVLLRLIQGGSFAFDPSMGLKIVFFFSNADTQTRIYSLSPEQSPEGQRFRQARRMKHSVPVCGIHHVRG